MDKILQSKIKPEVNDLQTSDKIYFTFRDKHPFPVRVLHHAQVHSDLGGMKITAKVATILC